MLAKDKEDFVDTICSMSDSNGGVVIVQML